MLLFLLLISLLTTINGIFPDGPAVYQVTEPVRHAEGPIWDSRKQLLYYVDIPAGKLLSYNYETRDLNYITLSGDVSIVAPSKSDPDLLLVAVGSSVVAVEWDGHGSEFSKQKLLTTVVEDHTGGKFNDGKADDQGRLWFGTMGQADSTGDVPYDSALYLITKSNLEKPEVVVSNVSTSNGLAWNSDRTKFYYIDSPTRKIIEYEFNDDLGVISNPRIAFDLSNYEHIGGVPDGMTIDSDDNLWVALYDGGRVIQVNPNDNTLLQEIAIPAQCVTSVMFGGPNLDVLFVTTSGAWITDEEKEWQPAAGAVFAIVNTGSVGVDIFWADIVEEI